MKRGGRAQFKKDLTGKVVVSKLDEETLQQISQATGGGYFRSSTGILEVEKVYRAVSQLEERQTGTGWVIEYDPRYQVPVFVAVILLMLNMILSEGRKKGPA